MRTNIWQIGSLGGVLMLAASGCGHAPPQELINARAAYDRVTKTTAVQLAPSEVHKAQESLLQAEQAYKDDAGSQQTKDLAYVAERKAELAQTLAAIEAAKREQAQLKTQENEANQRTRSELSNTKQDLNAERQARLQAEQQAADTLQKLADVKKDERGMVITLSGSVLFPSNKAKLLPSAESRLSEVADALLKSKEKNLLIEGFTDSRGSVSRNRTLSQQRADAVKNFFISRGYDGTKISTQGNGKERPVDDNTTAEGRANNRRVEIVVQPPSASSN